jgi:predicted DNA-binding transcriptional regulator AlpA
MNEAFDTDRDGNPDRWLTVAETMERVKMSHSTLYKKLKHDPSFPRSCKPGGRTFFVESEINAWKRSIEMARLQGDAKKQR